MSVNEWSVDDRKAMLALAVIQLKKEFVGIDGIIDEIADAILPWWLFPQHQIRPLIINLWGMTGSGKTALIKRLTELIQYQHMLMRFDMGEFGSSSSFLKYTLTRQLIQYNHTAPVILLDEFQFAKTKDETGKEVNNYNLRIIWDLLDSGELIYEPDGMGYYVGRAKKVLSLLLAFEKQGAKIKNGIITHRIQEVHEALSTYAFGYFDGTIDRSDPNKKPFQPEEEFISDVFCTGIHEMMAYRNDSWRDIQAKIKSMNSILEIYNYLADIYKEETSFKSMDLRKSLIFVVGNLDEAFVMSNNINPDIDADEFQRYTQKITIADIKKALQNRFRNEQIARLGNTHLVYHAFSHKNFEQLIEMHLNRTSDLVQERFNLTTKFLPAVHKQLYSEGVFPTQGVRPVISTIRNMIESNIAKVILHFQENAVSATHLNWDFIEDHYIIDFIKQNTKLSQLQIPVVQKVNSLRKSTHNDLQSLVAVHEAGHAIVSMYAAKVVPEYIITKTVDADSQGFTYILLPEDIITYKLLIDQIKIYLGGYVAEAHVFGKDYNTTGVSGDLYKVTLLAHQIFRDYGMHSLPARHNIHVYGGSPYQFTFDENMEERCRKIVQYCLEETVLCIKENEGMLLTISTYLADHSRIDKKDIIDMATSYHAEHQLALPTFVDKESYYDFRNKLFEFKENNNKISSSHIE